MTILYEQKTIWIHKCRFIPIPNLPPLLSYSWIACNADAWRDEEREELSVILTEANVR